jgi:hypothetical protein
MASAPPDGYQPALSAAQRRRLLKLIEDQYRGTVNSSQPIILDSFIRHVTPVSGAPKEMNFKRPRRKGKT